MEKYSSEVAYKSGVRPRELGTAPFLWLSPRLSPHSLPILLSGTTSCLGLFPSPEWCVLNEGWRLPFIVLPRQLSRGRLHFTQGGRCRNFHMKTGRVAQKSQAGQPPLGRPAYDLRHLSTAFEWTLLMLSGNQCKRRFPQPTFLAPGGLI